MEPDDNAPEAAQEAIEQAATGPSRADLAAARGGDTPRHAAVAAGGRAAAAAKLPGDERFGDPLSTAGPSAGPAVARGVSSLQPERESVVQELGMAGLQVWQSLSEAAGRGRGDQELAILFTDLVGFSSWALRRGTRRRSSCCARSGWWSMPRSSPTTGGSSSVSGTV